MKNQWIVPYKPYLLTRYNCHINVEVCSGVKTIMYVHKHIYKVHDPCAVYVQSDDAENVIDEIKTLHDERWFSLPEALLRIHINT